MRPARVAAIIDDMTSAPPLHILPHDRGGWRVQREGDERPLSEHGSETEAEHAAVTHAATSGAPEIIVHDRYARLHRAPSSRATDQV
jgi:hypothetical protein